MSPKKIFEKKIAILFHNFPLERNNIKAIIIDQIEKLAKSIDLRNYAIFQSCHRILLIETRPMVVSTSSENVISIIFWQNIDFDFVKTQLFWSFQIIAIIANQSFSQEDSNAIEIVSNGQYIDRFITKHLKFDNRKFDFC